MTKTSYPNSCKKRGFLSRLLPARDIIIRQQDSLRYYTLSTGVQAAFLGSILLLAAWGISSSYFYMRYEHIVSRKEKQSENIRSAYRNLLEDVIAYRDHVGEVASALDQNYQTMIQAVKTASDKENAAKNDAAEPDTERLSREHLRLSNEITEVKGRLSQLAEGNIFRALKPDSHEISFRKAMLQRDLAVSETKELKERLSGMEDLVSYMQKTQTAAFQKMTSLADGNIDSLEQKLSGIKQTLADAGLGMNSLLSRVRRDKETTGIGGPFIPVSIPVRADSKLNISLVSLNSRLDYWYDLSTLQRALPVGKPVDYIRITSRFGTRGDPFEGSPARHEALDLGGITGEPVYSTAPGKVIRAGRWGWYGNMVEIDHGMGFRTRYAHMDKVFVKKGDTVRSGDRIGSVGNTGRSTGSHLHYEIRVNGYAVDPINFVKANKNVFKS